MSRKKKVRLSDSAADEHIIVFYKGEMVDIICPKHKASESQNLGEPVRKVEPA
jgi:hypothetical protein